MIRTFEPTYDSGIVGLATEEFEARFIEAYRVGARQRFILLGQRLVSRVVKRSFGGPRLRPHHADLCSAGLVALIELFDDGIRAPLDEVAEHCRKAIYWKLRNWLKEQGVLGRKNGAFTLLDTDVSARVEDWNFIETIAADEKSRLAEMREQADPRNQIAYGWKQEVAELAADDQERELRREAFHSRIKRLAATEPAYLPPKPRKNAVPFDPNETAKPRELRARGMTWQAIGELLGISMTAAQHAARFRPEKSPQELREQSLLSQAYRRARREESERYRAEQAEPRGLAGKS